MREVRLHEAKAGLSVLVERRHTERPLSLPAMANPRRSSSELMSGTVSAKSRPSVVDLPPRNTSPLQDATL